MTGEIPRGASCLASIALLAVVTLALSGCECDDTTTVFAISEVEHNRLAERYGTEALPEPECERLCIEVQIPGPGVCVPCPGEGGGGGEGGAGAGGAGGTSCRPESCDYQRRFERIDECTLGTIGWSQPAVICQGSTSCG